MDEIDEIVGSHWINPVEGVANPPEIRTRRWEIRGLRLARTLELAQFVASTIVLDPAEIQFCHWQNFF